MATALQNTLRVQTLFKPGGVVAVDVLRQDLAGGGLSCLSRNSVGGCA